MPPVALTPPTVPFIRGGVIKQPQAFLREVADECEALLWAATGCDQYDPTTWTRPVIRLDYPYRSTIRDDAHVVRDVTGQT